MSASGIRGGSELDRSGDGRRIVVFGMGGTIAGRSTTPADTVGYQAGALPVGDLLEGIPRPLGFDVLAATVAQIDSKDLAVSHWRALAAALGECLQDPAVAAVVVTHGTDTFEETAYLLHRLLDPGCGVPVVMTAAMRPATALSADGPRNLADALQVVAQASQQGWRGVVGVLGGRVWSGGELRKRHSRRLDAFDAGDAGPLALVDDDGVRALRPWPGNGGLGLAVLETPEPDWPWVEVVTSHAGAHGQAVDALVAAGVHGLVIAATGNGTVHEHLEAAALRALARGVVVWRASRCAAGGIVTPRQVCTRAAPPAFASGTAPAVQAGWVDGLAAPRKPGADASPHPIQAEMRSGDEGQAEGLLAGLPGCGELTPVQARIELTLHLLLQGQRRQDSA